MTPWVAVKTTLIFHCAVQCNVNSCYLRMTVETAKVTANILLANPVFCDGNTFQCVQLMVKIFVKLYFPSSSSFSFFSFAKSPPSSSSFTSAWSILLSTLDDLLPLSASLWSVGDPIFAIYVKLKFLVYSKLPNSMSSMFKRILKQVNLIIKCV